MSSEDLGTQPTVFRRLGVENFRGFQRWQEFDLAASVILVRGPNGVGKTSLFDAMQWLLIGEIPRLRDARLRKTEEHILNTYAHADTAVVSATLDTPVGIVDVTRTGNRTGSSLVWQAPGSPSVMGHAAERALGNAFGANDEVSLETALTAAGLLQQDAARLVLQSSPKDRFTLFAQLLGLAKLQAFESWASQRAKDAGSDLKQLQGREAALRGRVRELDQRLTDVRLAARERASTADAQERLLSLLRNHAPDTLPEIDRDRAVRLSATASALAQECSELAGIASSLAAAPADPVTDERVAEVRGTINSVVELINTQLRVIADSETFLAGLTGAHADLERLVTAALPLIRDDACPLCQQRIPNDELHRRVRELAAPSAELASAAESIQRMRVSLAALEAERDRLAILSRELVSRQQVERAEADQRARFRERLAALGTPQNGIHLGLGGETPIGEALSATGRTMQELAGLARELVFAIDASKSTEEAMVEAELSKLRDQLERLSGKLQAEASRASAARHLAEAATDSRLDLVRERLEQLRPIAQDIYSRMDPHPTFTELQLVSEMFRSAGTTTAEVRDERADVSADPMLVFSAAQANVTAIAYLIALNWAAAGRIPMLLLDDPLQAMDDINVLGFADLCRHLRGSRQLIVSTHERRFADLLERKLAPRDTQHRSLVLEFTGWNRSGPDVKLRESQDQSEAGEKRAIFASEVK